MAIAACVVGDEAPTALDRRRCGAPHGTSNIGPAPGSPAVADGAAMSDSLVPRDHAEAVALFRAQVIGALARSQLDHGELAAELRKLAERKYRPPGRRATKQYGVSTLERWVYAYRHGGLVALRPEARSDRGRARELTPEQRALLLDVRREHPGASAALILRTLVLDGRIAKGAVSVSTVARLYRDAKLPRGVRPSGHTRLRWQAEHPGALWHGDVCHGPALRVGKTTKPLRIHALLDDASRYVVALEAHHTEREDDMLDLMLGALRRHGRPDAMYLDYVPRHIIEVLCPTALCARHVLLTSKTRNPIAVCGHITRRNASSFRARGCSAPFRRGEEVVHARALLHVAQDHRPGS